MNLNGALHHPQLGDPVHAYEYRNLAGETIFGNARFAEPKDFRVFTITNAGKVRWSIEGAPKLLYQLPRVEEALVKGETIWIVDGEKDADALCDRGHAATCCARAQGWSLELADQLIGARRVKIVADRDSGPGMAQALEVRDLLLRATGIGSHEIEIVQAAEGKDTYDHFEAGFGIEEFELVNEAQVLGQQEETPDSWRAQDLNGLPEQPPIPPNLGNTHLVYPGKRHVFSGPPESAKTLAAYCVLIQVVRMGGSAVLIDFEMGAYDARQRLRELGATPLEIKQIAYVEPEEKASPERVAPLIALEPSLVVIDAAAGVYALEGLDDNKRGDVEKISSLYIRAFWRAGIATILLDHVVKDTESRGRFAIGSERKLGGADVHFGFEVVGKQAISRGGKGKYKITTHKDRGGYLKRGHLADLDLTSDPDTHAITWAFSEPVVTTDDEGHFRYTIQMERISRHLEIAVGPLTVNQIKDDVTGQGKQLGAALDALVSEGYVSREDGPGSSKLHTARKPYRRDDDELEKAEKEEGDSRGSQWFSSDSGIGAERGDSLIPRVTITREPGTTSRGVETTPNSGGWFSESGELDEARHDDIDLDWT